MIYFYSFIFCGLICSLSQIILEKTKLTPGHVNTMLVILGCLLSGFGIYDKCISIFGGGAVVPIVNFGHLLVTGASEGYTTYGLIGLFKGVLVNASAGLSITILSSFIVSTMFKIKH